MNINPDRWHYENNRQINQNNPKYRVEHSESCGNSPEIFENCSTNPDAQRCADGSFPFIETIFGVEGDDEGRLISQGPRCPGDPAPGVPFDEILEEIRITPEQFRSFPIQPAELISDPEQFSLRNGHTHLWAESETQNFNTVIEGISVELRAIPIQWMWDYGDGTKRNLNHPGEPAPNHTLHHETPTSHSYTETGIFQVNLTTLYRGEFRIVGEGWQSIPGQAAVPSEAVPIDVWRTEKELVAPDGQ
ncbi:PKD domain-containing protein [Glutamicibacter sp. MNS18]|uniref:PKD domain-containing protein n=1 Tax=Glutamicibacter sp. MNS18 TaxID=2989817 RepID=UPI0022363C7A|nr:PKD domain-containing protein [Glutamicibacter sp. MNS18]MCW4464524.1 PKD domain-containing protein [Glutamicibacter sp. MNS18]